MKRTWKVSKKAILDKVIFRSTNHPEDEVDHNWPGPVIKVLECFKYAKVLLNVDRNAKYNCIYVES